jgi:hypothetical protein
VQKLNYFILMIDYNVIKNRYSVTVVLKKSPLRVRISNLELFFSVATLN